MLVPYTTGALVLAKEGEGKLHMAGAARAPFPRSEPSLFFYTMEIQAHFAQRGVFQGQKQNSPSEIST